MLALIAVEAAAVVGLALSVLAYVRQTPAGTSDASSE